MSGINEITKSTTIFVQLESQLYNISQIKNID